MGFALVLAVLPGTGRAASAGPPPGTARICEIDTFYVRLVPPALVRAGMRVPLYGGG